VINILACSDLAKKTMRQFVDYRFVVQVYADISLINYGQIAYKLQTNYRHSTNILQTIW